MASTSQADQDSSTALSSFEGEASTDSEEEIVRSIDEADKEYTNQLTGDEDNDDEEEDFLASDNDPDDDEEAYRRYEERSSFNHARIEIDEDYEEDLGFPMYYAGYTHRKKQLPLGMDCWKVKKIPADAGQLRAMLQDQKVRRELLGKVLEEVAAEKTRLQATIAAGV